MKLSECYDTTYTSRNYGRSDRIRPAVTARRAREIFEAAKLKMDPIKRSKVNQVLTVGQAYEILSKALDSNTPDDMVLHSLVSRNIVREFGAFL